MESAVYPPGHCLSSYLPPLAHKMLLKILLLLTLCTSSVTAFAASGAYERMLFWQAYQLDLARNDGKAKSVAKGCKPAPCNFVDFMKYIAATDQEKQKCEAMRQKLEGNGEGSSKGGKKGKGKAPQGKPFDGKGLTADEGAKVLVDFKITREYKCSLIVQQLHHPPQVFQAVAA